MIQKDASGSWAQIIIVSSIIEADPKKKKLTLIERNIRIGCQIQSNTLNMTSNEENMYKKNII